MEKWTGRVTGIKKWGEEKVSKVGARQGFSSHTPELAAGENLFGPECWCAERECAVCAVKYGQETVSEGSNSEAEIWDEGPDESWFLVNSGDGALKSLDSASPSDSDWELVASEVPFGDRSRGKEVLAPELDELQCQLKKFLSGERPRFRVGIEVSDQEEVFGDRSLFVSSFPESSTHRARADPASWFGT